MENNNRADLFFFSDFHKRREQKWRKEHPYYSFEDDPDVIRAKSIIKDYFEKDPFLLTCFISFIGYKDNPDLLWLQEAIIENPYIEKLYHQELCKWHQFPEIQNLRRELMKFLSARSIDRFGGEKEFYESFSKNAKTEYQEVQTSEAKTRDYYIAQKLFRKRFEALLKKYGIF